MEQCLQCQDTMSLYCLALKMMLNSLKTEREQHIIREVTYAVQRFGIISDSFSLFV